MTYTDLKTWFTAAPRPQDTTSLNLISTAALEFANVVMDNTPACADQTVAVRKIREAVWAAHASIACAGGDASKPGG